MGVYIKGMEMPKDGSWFTLRVFPDGQCFLYSWCGNDFDFMEHLTAVPVPPHGRLIDADKLHEATYHRAFETDDDTMWQSGCWVRYRAIEQVQDNQPTVIPADKDGET